MNKPAIMSGVVLILVLAALNQTMVATAMPQIVTALGGMHLYSWVFSGYMLAATVFVPVFGKLSDLFGRRPIILFGILAFTAGALLSGMAGGMLELIAYRALQGLGAAAMMPVAFAVVADLYAPADRGRANGLIGAAFGIASFLGPAAGGWLTDHASWRWAFFVNVPVGLFALAYTTFVLPRPRRVPGPVAIDYAGSVLLIGATGALMLLATLGGQAFPWLSAPTAAFAAGIVIAGAAFWWVERRAQNPIMPLGLFRNSIFAVSVTASLLTGVLMFGNTMFIPLFLQGVTGVSATAAGLVLTPMMLSNVAGSIASGQLASFWGRYRGLAIGGLVLLVAGEALLTLMNSGTTPRQVVLNMVVVGIGLGATMPIFVLAVQNAVPARHLGSVTSLVQFFRTMGGTLGVAGLGAVMTSELGTRVDPQRISGVAGAEAHRQHLAEALHHVFVYGLWFAVAGLAVTLLLKGLPLRKAAHGPAEEAGGTLAAEGLPAVVLRPEDEPRLLENDRRP